VTKLHVNIAACRKTMWRVGDVPYEVGERASSPPATAAALDPLPHVIDPPA